MDPIILNKEQLLSALKSLVEGRFSAKEWLAWWEANGETARVFVTPGQYLRLKPGTLVNGPVAAMHRSFAQACQILQSQGVDFTASKQLVALFDRDAHRRSGVTTFAARLNEVAERDFCAHSPAAV